MATWAKSIALAALFCQLSWGLETTTLPEPSSTTSLEVFTEDLPPFEEPPCYFLNDLVDSQGNDTVTLAMRKALHTRCLKIRSPEWIYEYGDRAISVDDIKCGVRSADSLDNVTSSDLCQSPQGQGTVMSFVHSFRLRREDYFKDYKDVRKRRFQNRKLEMEKVWGEEYLKSSVMMAAGFESVLILSFELPTNTTLKGIVVTAMIQFSTVFDPAAYEAEWDSIVIGTPLMLGDLEVEDVEIGNPGDCPILYEQLSHVIPTDIWDASGISETAAFRIGQSINFKCPDGKKISLDNDGFDDNDDKYTILCTTRGYYNNPKRVEEWPTCVNSCWRRLPAVPDRTGLEPVIPENTIPSGQHGKYVCTDTSLGVERGPSEFFEVICKPNGKYEVPIDVLDWPICYERTTTMSPVIPVALKSLLQAYKTRLEFRLQAYAWTDSENPLPPPEDDGFLYTVTLPITGGILIFVIVVMMMTRNDSPLCKVFELKPEHQYFSDAIKRQQMKKLEEDRA